MTLKKNKIENNNGRHFDLPGKPFCLKEKNLKCKYCRFIERGKRKGEWKKMFENNKKPGGIIGKVKEAIREMTKKGYLEDFLAHYDWSKARQEISREEKKN